jgi:hypothetical protein
MVRLELELIVDADPIAGGVNGPGEENRSFSGWLELTRAIELALDAAGRSDPGQRVSGG